MALDATYAIDKDTMAGFELYDLNKDPQELQNVYDDPEYHDMREEVKEFLISLKDKYGDTDTQDDDLQKLYDKLK
ncbi:MAG: hypothetical protein ATN31_06885 [Candidatus Epulonipiscioides saccharophilum]|nr:MAG: hypothetical protein ATN31_06885 [Epulopiscium sp. AS2M-Bin001]